MKRKKQASSEDLVKKVGVYYRVSSLRQARDGDSLEAQQNMTNRFLETQREFSEWVLESTVEYREPGRSAKDEKHRPVLQQLKEDVRQGKINTVVATKLDRISRNVRDFLNLWDFFEQHGVTLHLVREKFDTSSPYGRLFMVMTAAFAELERENIRENTLKVMLDRTERGLRNGSPCLGYVSSEGGKGRLVVEEEGAKLVRLLFNLFEEMGSAGAVIRELHRRGIKYPVSQTRDGRTRGGKPFKKQQVIRLLRNPVYIGWIKWGGLVTRDAHLGIITEEQFERVATRLEETTARRRNFRIPRKKFYLLSGLLRCQCGSHMVGASYHGRSSVYRYYVCTRQVHEANKASCQAPRIPADDLEAAVIERITDVGNRDEARTVIVEKALAGVESQRGELAEQESILRRQITQTRASIGRLMEVLKDRGAGGFASIKDELTRLEAEDKSLSAELKQVTDRQRPLDAKSTSAAAFLATWTGVGDLLGDVPDGEKQQILQHYIEVIEFRETDAIRKVGVYALQLFPEVRRYFDTERGEGDVEASSPPKPPRTPNGATLPAEGSPFALTEDGVVCTAVRLAPRLGLEPRT
ncbi:MAG: recombinase family protein [Gemmataceae bacterium]|nr:recombinase family protein [Gemmataceae bacterium]